MVDVMRRYEIQGTPDHWRKLISGLIRPDDVETLAQMTLRKRRPHGDLSVKDLRAFPNYLDAGWFGASGDVPALILRSANRSSDPSDERDPESEHDGETTYVLKVRILHAQCVMRITGRGRGRRP